MDGRAIIAHLDICGGKGVAFNLIQFGCYSLVFYRVGALLIKRLIDLDSWYDNVDITCRVRCFLLSVDCHLLDGSGSPEVLP